VFKLNKLKESTQPAVAKPAIAPPATAPLSSLRKQRRLVKAKEQKDGNWKEF